MPPTAAPLALIALDDILVYAYTTLVHVHDATSLYQKCTQQQTACRV